MKEGNNPEFEPDSETGLGNLLKTEREKKGLSTSQIAEITRLRKHFVEALENEEWEKLPARVFVKGFIRSYALSIDLDVNEAMRLFEISAPRVEEQNFSKALITAEKRKSKIIYLLLPLIALAAIFFYLTSEWDWNKEKIPEPAIASMNNSPEKTETAGPVKQPDLFSKEDSIIQEVNQEPETTGTVLLNSPVEENIDEILLTEVKTDNIKEEDVREKETAEWQIPPSEQSKDEENLQEDTGTDNSGLVLTGIVSMKTYIKMFVDDNPPKEGIFRPGSRPQWTGEKGFYVVVGNAAGIEFDFNGTIIRNLGKPDQVKTFRFPENFQSEWEE
ncbi:helix-turn-helix domain-containing protein [Thermodesulfobacteriota bacterium]